MLKIESVYTYRKKFHFYTYISYNSFFFPSLRGHHFYESLVNLTSVYANKHNQIGIPIFFFLHFLTQKIKSLNMFLHLAFFIEDYILEMFLRQSLLMFFEDTHLVVFSAGTILIYPVPIEEDLIYFSFSKYFQQGSFANQTDFRSCSLKKIAAYVLQNRRLQCILLKTNESPHLLIQPAS